MKDQLLYLWLSKTSYPCFEDVEFNFSAELNFRFNKENKAITVDRTNKINIFDKNNVLDINENICNITAIVGNNGVGKTTLLHSIMKLWKLKYEIHIHDENHYCQCIFVVIENGRLKLYNDSIYSNVYIKDSINIFSEHEEIINLNSNRGIFNNIYLNPTVVYISLENKYTSSFGGLLSDKFIPLTPRQIENAGRQFLNKKSPNFIKTRITKFAHFDFENFIFGLFYAQYEEHLLIKKSNEIKLYIAPLYNIQENNSLYDFLWNSNQGVGFLIVQPEDSLYIALHKSLISELLGSYNNLLTQPDYHRLENLYKEGFYNSKETIIDIFAHLFKYPQEVEEYICDAICEIEIVSSLLESYQHNVLFDGLYVNRDDIIKICKCVLYNKHSFLFKYIHFDISGSDGELAYLRHISYLYFISNPYIYLYAKQRSLSNNILLMLDEADIHLHPEWQRQLIKNLIIAINKVFPGKNVQLIFTTHSPIVLSDIPSQNIIYIENNNGNKKIYKDLNRNTFGANIYDLYNNSFFFSNNVLMGDYAKDFIDSLYLKLKNSGDDSLHKYIDLIGDPNLKRELRNVITHNISEEEILTKDDVMKQIKNNIEYLRKLLKEMEEDKDD